MYCLANCAVSVIVRVRVYSSSIKKKNQSRQRQWKHTSTPWNYFFLSLDFPYEYTESFPTIFYYAPVRLFRLTRGAALAMLASTVCRRITARASRSAGASRRYNGSFWVCCAPVTILRQRSPMSEVDRFCSIRTLRLVVHAFVVHARSQRQLQN